jgi:hypothetical protein
MQPRWQLDYWTGRAPGVVVTDGDPDVVEVPLARWRGDRPDLAEHFSRDGARLLHLDDAQGAVGCAIVLPPSPSSHTWEIARMVAIDHDRAARATLSALPPGADVSMCAPDHSGLAGLMGELGFRVTDRDTFCASDGVAIDRAVVALHPGLG